MNFQRAAKILEEELNELGYTCRLDLRHGHPRLYIKSNGEERFAILSSTGNYAEGNLLDMKRQDIRRDVLPHLPKPKVEAKPSMKNAPEPKTEVDNRVFKVKIYIMGRGVLCLQLPAEAIPPDKPTALPYLTADESRLYLVFSKSDGHVAKAAKSPGDKVYYFARSKVPFVYAERSPEGFKAPEFCARFRGGSLICDEPLPQEMLVTQVRPKKGVCDVTEGKDILEMLNAWLTVAEKQGLDPKVSVEKNRVHIKIEVKIEQEL